MWWLADNAPYEAYGHLQGRNVVRNNALAVEVHAWSFELGDSAAECDPKYLALNSTTEVTLHTHTPRTCLEKLEQGRLTGEYSTEFLDCSARLYYLPSVLDISSVVDKELPMHIVVTPFAWYLLLNNRTTRWAELWERQAGFREFLIYYANIITQGRKLGEGVIATLIKQFNEYAAVSGMVMIEYLRETVVGATGSAVCLDF